MEGDRDLDEWLCEREEWDRVGVRDRLLLLECVTLREWLLVDKLLHSFETLLLTEKTNNFTSDFKLTWISELLLWLIWNLQLVKKLFIKVLARFFKNLTYFKSHLPFLLKKNWKENRRQTVIKISSTDCYTLYIILCLESSTFSTSSLQFLGESAWK